MSSRVQTARAEESSTETPSLRGSFNRALALWIGFVIPAIPTTGASPTIERAVQKYRHTQYAEALGILLPLSEKDGRAYELIGQCYYMEGQTEAAADFFEKAVSADPSNSVYHHWLGRAYGRRAEVSNIFKAPYFARKARARFEAAVRLDPRNIEALNDLFEYCLEAPAFLGGGTRKSAAVAERIRELDVPEYQYALARLAEKQQHFAEAERHLRLAAEMVPQDPGRWIDLAQFFEEQGRYFDADEIFGKAAALAPNSPKVVFAMAKAYVRSRRYLDAAKALLERYPTLDLSPDDPPRQEAEKLRGRIPRP